MHFVSNAVALGSKFNFSVNIAITAGYGISAYVLHLLFYTFNSEFDKIIMITATKSINSQTLYSYKVVNCNLKINAADICIDILFW